MLNNSKLYCLRRKVWVAATPEEYIRQSTLKLLQDLEYPFSYIVVEKDLKLLPNLSFKGPSPERRIDIICYTKKKEDLVPLLLVECKAVPFSQKEIQQVLGYNHLIKAPFVGLVNSQEERLGWFDNQSQAYQFINYIPRYVELVNSIIVD